MEHGDGEVLIFTCAGASHAGQAVNQAGIELMRQKDGNLFCLAAMSADIPEKVGRARDAGVLVAIDGCEDHCCRKTLENAGLVADVQVVATDLGIPKKPEKPHMAEDVQHIVGKVQADMLALAN